MRWIRENKLAATIILVVVLIYVSTVLVYVSTDKRSNNKRSRLDEMGQGVPLEKNILLENVYRSSIQLPEHNTACFPVEKSLCGKGVCRDIEPKVFILLIASTTNPTLNPAIARCDSEGCDMYDAIFESSGEYVNIQPINPKGFIFKMSLTGLRFVEAVTLGLDTHISYGYCVFKSEK